jgi:hypothetical protein
MPTINNLPVLTTATTATVFLTVDDSTGVPTTKQATFGQLSTFFASSLAVNSVAGKQGDVVLYYTDIHGTPTIATTTTVGAVKVGSGLLVDDSGTISVGGNTAKLVKGTVAPNGNNPNEANDIWYDGNSGRLYVWYIDPVQNYGSWVDASPGVKPSTSFTSTSFLNITNTTSNALGVSGGAVVNKDISVGGNVITTSIISPTGSGSNISINPDGLGDLFITPSTQVYINDTATSVTTATGALVVKGGVGIGGNLNVGGLIKGVITTATTLANGSWTVYISNTGTLVLPNNLQVINTEYVNNIVVNTETITSSIVFPDGSIQTRAFTSSTTASNAISAISAQIAFSLVDPNSGTTTLSLNNAVLPSTPLDLGSTSSQFKTLYASGKMFIGSGATAVRFSNTNVVVSTTPSGIQQNETGNIGILGEAVGAGATRNAGVYGVGYTAGSFSSQGVIGEGHVSATSDTAPSVGVRGYANDAHSGGTNVGLYGDATNSAIGNYSIYLNSGDIYTAGAKVWYLNGNLSFNGAYTISGTITTATYAQSFNTATLVASSVNAQVATTATTAGYATTFNTATLVASSVNAQVSTTTTNFNTATYVARAAYADSFNTATLVATALSVINSSPSSQIATTPQTASSTYYPVFVSNNSAGNQAAYTTSSFVVDPSTGQHAIGVGSTPTAGFALTVGVPTIVGSGGIYIASGSVYSIYADRSMQVGWGNAALGGTYPSFKSTGSVYTGDFQIGFSQNTGRFTPDIATADGGTIFDTIGAFPLSIGTNSTERLRITSTGTVRVYSTLSSISTTTGALQVIGGVGIGGSVNIGGNITAANFKKASGTNISTGTIVSLNTIAAYAQSGYILLKSNTTTSIQIIGQAAQYCFGNGQTASTLTATITTTVGSLPGVSAPYMDHWGDTHVYNLTDITYNFMYRVTAQLLGASSNTNYNLVIEQLL